MREKPITGRHKSSSTATNVMSETESPAAPQKSREKMAREAVKKFKALN